MNDDLIDAVKWAIDGGSIDPRKVAIVGQGYGGFEVLTALETTPDTFACGIDAFGPVNLATSLAAPVARGGLPKATLFKRVANPTDPADKEWVAKVSPLSGAEKIKVPLLVVHGANDPHVKGAEVEQLLAKVPTAASVTYLDEADDFTRSDNRLDFAARVDVFLAQCLGGRFEPLPKPGGSSAIAKPARK
jgi:dipeptidyl aminopeptidase/acylaminoacyl peptidase